MGAIRTCTHFYSWGAGASQHRECERNKPAYSNCGVSRCYVRPLGDLGMAVAAVIEFWMRPPTNLAHFSDRLGLSPLEKEN